MTKVDAEAVWRPEVFEDQHGSCRARDVHRNEQVRSRRTGSRVENRRDLKRSVDAEIKALVEILDGKTGKYRIAQRHCGGACHLSQPDEIGSGEMAEFSQLVRNTVKVNGRLSQ